MESMPRFILDAGNWGVGGRQMPVQRLTPSPRPQPLDNQGAKALPAETAQLALTVILN